MAAEVSLATRHVMQANKSKNTKPELLVRQGLREAGLPGYRLHWKKAPGKPDVCYPGRKVAIFVHGCFWHRCPHCNLGMPKTNTEFWERKFQRNRERDARDNRLLVEDGWKVIVVWECQLKKARLEGSMQKIVSEVEAAGAGSASVGHVVEVGATPAWRHRKNFRKGHPKGPALRARRGRRH